MALAGGGGAGNVAGSNPAGIGTSLNIIGNHAYATNNVGAASSPVTALLFSTGSEYHVGTIQLNMGLQPDATSDAVGYLQVEFDGQLVVILTAGLTAADSQVSTSQNILIPPYTRVQIIGQTDDGGTECGCALVGRMH